MKKLLLTLLLVLMSFTLVFAAGTKEEAAEVAGGSVNAYTTLEDLGSSSF